MDLPVVACTKCAFPLRAELSDTNRGTLAACRSCGSLLEVHLLTAAFQAPTSGRAGEPVLAPGEATCFNHPAKRAQIACESCGRFLYYNPPVNVEDGTRLAL